MQVTASLEKGVLIPIRKEQRERFKNANQMIAADNGGVIFKPITGLYTNVVEIDFFSMYPHIMTKWNISAETVGEVGARTRIAPGIGVPINLDNPGIVAEVLKPILKKRAEAKYLLENKKTEGYNKDYLQTAYEFLKGLGWVSYGYQGFSGNRIGSIEAHEAINAVSRNVILQAKEAAEDTGFEVLHIYVDSLFAHLDGHTQIQIDDLLAEIKTRTKLTADHEGTFRWIAFLPSKQNELVPVPNCFFGVFESGEPKCRGIMARRGDTPLYIADVQMLAIGMMAKERNLPGLRKLIPPLVEFFKTHFRKISSGEVALDQLVISQTLSRDIEDFKVITPANAAARQLEEHGKVIRAGQNVEFLRVRNRPRSLSWHLVREDQKPDLDTEWYCGQLLRAADELLSSFGIPREMLRDWLTDKGVYWLPQDFINQSPTLLPLLANTCQSRRLEFINC
jgi:DNA polymerase-2